MPSGRATKHTRLLLHLLHLLRRHRQHLRHLPLLHLLQLQLPQVFRPLGHPRRRPPPQHPCRILILASLTFLHSTRARTRSTAAHHRFQALQAQAHREWSELKIPGLNSTAKDCFPNPGRLPVGSEGTEQDEGAAYRWIWVLWVVE